MGKFIDMIGQVFGRWTVLSYHHTDKWGNAYWLCRCICGTEVVVAGHNLRRGHSRSCGCLNREIVKELAKEKFTTHGLSEHPLYGVWGMMNDRCNNPDNKDYHNYGGRTVPIVTCDRWHQDNPDGLQNFITDMYPTYKPGLTIERTENDSDYNAENCTWATMKEQSNNKRNTRFVAYQGKEITLTQLIDITGTTIPRHVLDDRIFVWKWPIEKALTTPVRKSTKTKENERVRNQNE
jgi:hypothetical protein